MYGHHKRMSAYPRTNRDLHKNKLFRFPRPTQKPFYSRAGGSRPGSDARFHPQDDEYYNINMDRLKDGEPGPKPVGCFVQPAREQPATGPRTKLDAPRPARKSTRYQQRRCGDGLRALLSSQQLREGLVSISPCRRKRAHLVQSDA